MLFLELLMLLFATTHFSRALSQLPSLDHCSESYHPVRETLSEFECTKTERSFLNLSQP